MLEKKERRNKSRASITTKENVKTRLTVQEEATLNKAMVDVINIADGSKVLAKKCYEILAQTFPPDTPLACNFMNTIIAMDKRRHGTLFKAVIQLHQDGLLKFMTFRAYDVLLNISSDNLERFDIFIENLKSASDEEYPQLYRKSLADIVATTICGQSVLEDTKAVFSKMNESLAQEVLGQLTLLHASQLFTANNLDNLAQLYDAQDPDGYRIGCVRVFFNNGLLTQELLDNLAKNQNFSTQFIKLVEWLASNNLLSNGGPTQSIVGDVLAEALAGPLALQRLVEYGIGGSSCGDKIRFLVFSLISLSNKEEAMPLAHQSVYTVTIFDKLLELKRLDAESICTMLQLADLLATAKVAKGDELVNLLFDNPILLDSRYRAAWLNHARMNGGAIDGDQFKQFLQAVAEGENPKEAIVKFSGGQVLPSAAYFPDHLSWEKASILRLRQEYADAVFQKERETVFQEIKKFLDSMDESKPKVAPVKRCFRRLSEETAFFYQFDMKDILAWSWLAINDETLESKKSLEKVKKSPEKAKKHLQKKQLLFVHALYLMQRKNNLDADDVDNGAKDDAPGCVANDVMQLLVALARYYPVMQAPSSSNEEVINDCSETRGKKRSRKGRDDEKADESKRPKKVIKTRHFADNKTKKSSNPRVAVEKNSNEEGTQKHKSTNGSVFFASKEDKTIVPAGATTTTEKLHESGTFPLKKRFLKGSERGSLGPK